MKKILASLLAAAMMLSMAACGDNSNSKTDEADADKKATIGVSMPTKSLQRWNQDGANIKEKLEASGYQVDLQYADNKVEQQVSQIENMITKGVDVLVIAAIDGSSLTSVLDSAKSDDISVISYDRLIMNSDAVSYYATFDNYKVGQIQGQYIIDKLGLKDGKGPYNFEITTGPVDDNNVVYFFGGAMDLLQPYIDKGQLVVKSGQKTKEACATPNWDEQQAQTRMDNILTANYSSENVDVVLCSNDSTSLGVQSALKSVGYGSADKPMPLITGQDGNIANVQAIIAGDQAMSVFKDTRTLAAKVVEMVSAIVEGTEPTINDTKTYNNGKLVVPSFLCDPEFVDLDNYDELLVKTGYYTEAELKK